MANKKEGILSKLKGILSNLKNAWNNLGIDTVDYKFTDDEFQGFVDKHGLDKKCIEDLIDNSAYNCAERLNNSWLNGISCGDLPKALRYGSAGCSPYARAGGKRAKNGEPKNGEHSEHSLGNDEGNR